MFASSTATLSSPSATDDDAHCLPFLKWAGGKRWLVHRYAELVDVPFQRYVEPFLGSGAVFFHLQPFSAVLSDLNKDLIHCYKAISDDWLAVAKALSRHHRRHSENYYYEERGRQHRSYHEKAAQFIYLNRTCWNGLYRVNRNGEFNVPKGTKKSVILDTDNFKKVSEILRTTTIQCQDFEETLRGTGPGDFVFVDPPYTVKHNNNGFLKYNESIFSWSDQVRLHSCLVSAKNRGAEILLLNAHHESIRDLYRDFGQHKILSRNSVLSGDPAYRCPATELAIFSYGST